MNFEVQIAHSVTEIGQEAWDHLGQGRPFHSYRWYRFGETVMADDLPIHIFLSRHGEPVARASLWVKRQDPMPVSSRVARHLIHAVLRRWPLLLCQAPLATMPALALPDPPLRKAALETLSQVALDQARRHKASFLGFVYMEEQEAAYDGWSNGFDAVELPEPGTRLEIRWPSFQDYLKNCLSKNERKHYRRNCRRVDEMGVKVTPHESVTRVDKAMELIRNLEERYNEPPIPWTQRLLENASMVDATWMAAWAGDRLVACELLIGDRGTWFATALGRDYDFPYVYFVLGYRGIQQMIEGDARFLDWGSAAYDVKRRLGFELKTNNHMVFSGRGPLFYRLGRWLAKMEESYVEDPYEELLED